MRIFLPAAHAGAGLKWRCAILLALALLGGTPAGRAEAEDDPARKAAVVYNLSKFIDWPESAFSAAPDDFILCLLGGDPARDALEAVAGKSVRGRKIGFREVDAAQAADGGCHVLFVGLSAEAEIAALLPRIQDRPILTVSDIGGFAARGGMAGLMRTGDRIRFEINLDAAKQAGLSVSTPLLELANVVRTPE